MADKLRVFQLAKELNVDSKAILSKCVAEGLDVKNHMSTLSAGLAATIREWFSEGTHTTTDETTERVDLGKVRKKPSSRKKKTESTPEESAAQPPSHTKAITKKSATHQEDSETESTVAVLEAPAIDAAKPLMAEFPTPPTDIPAIPIEVKAPPVKTEKPSKEIPAAIPRVTPIIPELTAPKPVKPVGPQHVPQPAQLQGPRVIRVEKPDPVSTPIRRPLSTPRPLRHTGLSSITPSPAALRPPTEPASGRNKARSKTYKPEEEEEASKRRAAGRRGRGSDAGEQLLEWRDQDLAERQERVRAATGRKAKRRASESTVQTVHKAVTQAEVSEPIILKDFCAATGLSMVQLTPKMVGELQILPNINMTLTRELAELLATEFGIELTVVAARSSLDDIREEFKGRARTRLQSRAPVVTFLGHVDHGKTSLLDAIRHSKVTEGEAGGITQHMGSYHLNRDGLAVTFLDTPGHEAFTAMRARGAQMTDVVVLVVAADDGIMPQTIEAINHAKAANVNIVVALNKIDLPGVDINKIYGQLSEYELTPTEWGGHTDVIKTSATKKTGINELIAHLSTLSELMELKADPMVPASGRVIDAQMKAGSGAVARMLVQEGTLRKGDIIVAGPVYGKVRSIYDHQGIELVSAGPSMPVELAGLDDLPAAGDEFYQVDSLKRAEQVAEEVKQQRRKASLSIFNKPRTLEDLFGQRKSGRIPELNIIVKADVQGSIDVLKKTLGEIPSDQVKLNVLHSGVGGISQSDVLLAEASQALIIGFQVVADNNVRRLADEHNVDIRLYRVIYNVLDDIKKALEGLLAPDEKIEQRGQAEVRNIFKVGKIGTVAGCYVRDGQVARNHKVRIIRDSVIVRDNADLHSLRRFKDDVKEVKSGYECGIKIEGFDDVKPGDVIEAYEIIKIAKKL